MVFTSVIWKSAGMSGRPFVSSGAGLCQLLHQHGRPARAQETRSSSSRITTIMAALKLQNLTHTIAFCDKGHCQSVPQKQ